MGNTLVWEKGRQFKQYGANTYKYNNEGIRIRKQTSTEIHEYILDGTNIVKEIVTDTANCPKYVNEYLYDLDGTVCGIKHNGTAYYFYKNLQGDIIAITDDAGVTVARYTYDAWGKVLSITDANGTDISETEPHIANINPFRYRSYYYDTETKLYYLQSRYYNPEVGRFINADEPRQKNAETSSVIVNSFAYCSNSPIVMSDPKGTWGRKNVGTGIQIMLSFHVALFTFFVGIELIWYKKKYGSHSKALPWGYWFYGGCLVVLFNPAELLGDMAAKQVKSFSVTTLTSFAKNLSKTNLLKNLSIQGIGGALGLMPSIDISLCVFNVTAKNFSHPKDYLGWFTLSQSTLFGITSSKGRDSSKNIISKGVGVSATISTFPFAFSLLTFGNGGGRAFYNKIPLLFKE